MLLIAGLLMLAGLIRTELTVVSLGTAAISLTIGLLPRGTTDCLSLNSTGVY